MMLLQVIIKELQQNVVIVQLQYTVYTVYKMIMMTPTFLLLNHLMSTTTMLTTTLHFCSFFVTPTNAQTQDTLVREKGSKWYVLYVIQYVTEEAHYFIVKSILILPFLSYLFIILVIHSFLHCILYIYRNRNKNKRDDYLMYMFHGKEEERYDSI